MTHLSKTYNYTYLINELSTNMKYIGVRSCDIPIEEDLGIKYIGTSSVQKFNNRQISHPEDYTYTLLENFDTRFEADQHEEYLHTLYGVKHNSEYYNLIEAKASINPFNTIGQCTVIDTYLPERKPFLVFVDDPLYISKRYISVSCGRCTVRDIHGNSYNLPVDDPRILSGKLYSHIKGKAVVKDIYNKVSMVSVDHHDYKNGKLIGIQSNWYLIDNIIYSASQVMCLFGVNASTIMGRCLSITYSTWQLIGDKLSQKYIESYEIFTCDDLESLRDSMHTPIPTMIVKDRYNNKFKIDETDTRWSNGEVTGLTGTWFIIDNVLWNNNTLKILLGINSNKIARYCKKYNWIQLGLNVPENMNTIPMKTYDCDLPIPNIKSSNKIMKDRNNNIVSMDEHDTRLYDFTHIGINSLWYSIDHKIMGLNEIAHKYNITNSVVRSRVKSDKYPTWISLGKTL